MGIMFLVLVPLPYVDASSASAFPDRRKRALVGAAGVIVEMFLASVALFFGLTTIAIQAVTPASPARVLVANFAGFAIWATVLGCSPRLILPWPRASSSSMPPARSWAKSLAPSNAASGAGER